MENTKKILTAMLLILLAASIITPLTTFTASAAPETLTPVTVSTDGNWTYVKNSQITIVFPAGEKKPMFLWWHTNDTDNINVVKFKGLIEYSTYERPYFLWRCQSDALEIKQQIRMMYADKYTMKGGMHVGEVWRALSDIGNFTNLHAPYLPFESSTWTLDPPVNVTQGSASYLSFNFTLTQVPGQRERFAFAENNIIIRCRFYYTPATVDVHGQYSYMVSAGEFKIDLIIKHWEWNVDKLQNVITELNSVGLNIPSAKAGLALWVNLASINLTKLQMADEDSRSVTDTSYTERVSNAPAMYVEGQMVSVAQNKTGSDETQMGNSVRDRFKITFEKGNATLAGFFKFVPQAIITNGQTYNTTDVTASYVSAGGHLRLFIGFPYFGSKTLEYDPSFGLEQISTWLPTSLLAILVGASIVIAVAVIAVRMRRRTTDIADVR